ncbi:hypothetical protein T492DRAFT_888767 [Pavlovales sp. CCMP2436]|nr:hypothetical protein T492DRAFT_888767 [Pavlovales sp. CCMP2436]
MSSGAHNAAKPGGQKFKHSLKTVGRTVMAAQRFAEGASFDNDDGGTSAHASNMHRSEASVPFGALIHFMTFSTEPELSKPWQMKKPQVSTGTGFYIGNKRILTNSHPGNFPARVLCEGVMRMCPSLTTP